MNRRELLLWLGATTLPSTAFGVVAARRIWPRYDEGNEGLWIPTQEQVDDWRDFYTLATVQVGGTINQRVRALAAVEPGEEDPDVGAFLSELDHLERAFAALDARRSSIARAHGDGYFAGREAKPRVNTQFVKPSNEAFSWYNGWRVGNTDYANLVRRAASS